MNNWLIRAYKAGERVGKKNRWDNEGWGGPGGEHRYQVWFVIVSCYNVLVES
jgi:hypothetical protein